MKSSDKASTAKAVKFRSAVGLIVANSKDQVLVARRNDLVDQWQFPQGGISRHESPLEAGLRELEEETGILPSAVEVLGMTEFARQYDYPQWADNAKFLNAGQELTFILLRFIGSSDSIDVHCVPHPEFDAWKWIEYWEPVNLIVDFKKHVYREALSELEPLLKPKG